MATEIVSTPAPSTPFQDMVGSKQKIDSNDLYVLVKELETQLGFLELQEDYIRDDQKNLKRELVHAKAEILRIRSVPLVIGQFLEMIDEHHGIASSTAGSNYYIRVLSTLNRYWWIVFHWLVWGWCRHTDQQIADIVVDNFSNLYRSCIECKTQSV